jgi:hypothetical protein
MSAPELEPGCAPICYECRSGTQATCYYSGLGCDRLDGVNRSVCEAWRAAEAIAAIHDRELRETVAVAAGDAFDNVMPAECFPYADFITACGVRIKVVADGHADH